MNLADAVDGDVHTTLAADEVKSLFNAFTGTATASISGQGPAIAARPPAPMP